MDSLVEKKELAILIKQLCVKTGNFTLASGKQSNYYIDLRKATLHNKASKLIGELMFDLLKEQKGIIDKNGAGAVGGLTMGADPVAFSIMFASKNSLNAFVVRKQTKEHGMQNQIEGPCIKNQKVIIVEDTSTTGSSVIAAIDAAKNAGATIVAVAVVVDRNTGAKEKIEKLGYKYYSLLSKEDLGL